MEFIIHNPYFIPILPALAFATVLFSGARTPGRGAYLVIGAMTVSCLWSLVLLWWLLMGGEIPSGSFVWAVAGVELKFGFTVDAGSACMLGMVSFVGLLIIIYSQGYMHEDPRYSRFFAYLGLFSAAMLNLVLTNNLVMLFCSWELVGLMSYMLIGFWFEKPEAARAAKKAFMTTRIGDVLFTLGILTIFVVTRSLDLDVIFQEIPKQPAGMKCAIALLLFGGAVGKSAQFPLHVWLPDAMEGPTPVSALIHAATMVAAGVFLVWRMSPVFAATHGEGRLDATVYVASIGAVTAVMAATMAIVQTDIKRVLAYSTISQLGYMMLGLGAGLYMGHFGGQLYAGLFHLLTHAFFKALLFMAAGSVIIGSHHHQDIAQLGGLARKMPITCATFVIGALALCGVGIPGLDIGFAGFHSKDAILADALIATHHGLPPILYWLGICGAGLTAFYMTRCVVLTFWTRPRDRHVYEHTRETPPVMTVPLIVLALLSVCAGWFGPQLKQFLVERDGYTRPDAVAVAHAEHVLAISGEARREEHEKAHAQVAMTTTAIVAVSVALGLALYWRGRERAEELRRRPVLRTLYNILVHKYYQDDIWAVGIRGVIYVAIWCAYFDFWVVDLLVRGWGPVTVWISRRSLSFDLAAIDGFLVHLAPRITYVAGFLLSFLQTGSVQNYLLIVALGSMSLTALVAFRQPWPLWAILATAVITAIVAGAMIQAAQFYYRRCRAVYEPSERAR